jgi:hypothetical protein
LSNGICFATNGGWESYTHLRHDDGLCVKRELRT